MNEVKTETVRQRMHAASGRIARVKAWDRVARAVITMGGLGVVASVLFIFLFILGEAWPLFQPATASKLASADASVLRGALALGVDEYQRKLFGLMPAGILNISSIETGRIEREEKLPDLGVATLTSGSRNASGSLLVAGTSDGRAGLVHVRFQPRYESDKLVDVSSEVRAEPLIEMDPGHRSLRLVDGRERDGAAVVVAVAGDREIAVMRKESEDAAFARAVLEVGEGESITHLQLARTDLLAAATDRGGLYLWELGSEIRLVDNRSLAPARVTAMAWANADISLLVGDDQGGVAAYFRVRVKDDDPEPVLVRAHVYEKQSAALVGLVPSVRDKSFLAVGQDGSLRILHLTSERVIASLASTEAPIASTLVAPKNDGVLAILTDGRLARYGLKAPHPEVSARVLFGKAWYEGYPQPEYVWQSTGSTDEFEPKFSMVPLVFGTIKATVYAMLFAVPIALMAALYTSQFAHPSIRQKIKPTVEIMAALPSVVVGFIAGLWLASRVEAQIVPVLLMTVLLPALGTSGVLFWDALPQRLRSRLRPGTELAVVVPLCLLGALLALAVGPAAERAFFGADFKGWLGASLGLVYDQRNSIVVGLAMGFAVIPIIFTITEDAFSSVPGNLTAASLALGASRWQTAVRVVLPTASPGLFSAIMVGFGRAVGETMIVLMATGNTPVMDWSVFNGMRTLSANIAVEIPEAPNGGTLFRVLFLAALLLFAMTFVVNTLAEIVRQRLRERYKAL
ncbi:MAG: ABC transporter permease subunit [Vicinamibacteria bacterium]|nr:ABC transporter permease subunit [Vicinamibacteria bacterium]